jgi:hypothetical protein
MKSIFKFFLTVSVLLSNFAFSQTRSQPFPDFSVLDYQRDSSTNWSAVRPNTNHVVLILDAQTSNSLAMLTMYKSKGFEGQGVWVIVSGDSGKAKSFIKTQQNALPQASWFVASPQVLSIALKQAGAPHMYGVNAESKITWSYAGVPPSGERAIGLVNSWLAMPSNQPASTPIAR